MKKRIVCTLTLVLGFLLIIDVVIALFVTMIGLPVFPGLGAVLIFPIIFALWRYFQGWTWKLEVIEWKKRSK